MSTTLVKTYPVMEVFGPVIQGEGPVAGQVTHFIRFGLCDYRCSWCDSMFAVEPRQVKEHAEQLTTEQIVERLGALEPAPMVTLSGGNPAMHDLEELVLEIQEQAGMEVVVETQGSLWKDWLALVDLLVVSPKPPSSGMATDKHRTVTEAFMIRAEMHVDSSHRALKIVVFDELDLEWADVFMFDHDGWTNYLSVGTDVPVAGERLEVTRHKVCERYRWLCERAPHLTSEVTVYPQLHVLAYGHARGV